MIYNEGVRRPTGPDYVLEQAGWDARIKNISGVRYLYIINPNTGEPVDLRMSSFLRGWQDIDNDGIIDCQDDYIKPTKDNLDGDFLPDREDPNISRVNSPYEFQHQSICLEGDFSGSTNPNEINVIPIARPVECGNSIVETGEQCDGSIPRGASCQSLGFISGTLGCVPPGRLNSCKFDTVKCFLCGNGVINKDKGDTCHDGNLRSGDGCSSTCRREGGGAPGGKLKSSVDSGQTVTA